MDQTATLVSTTLDHDKNLIERFEDRDSGKATLRITLHKGTSKTAAEVEAWYWKHVGMVTPPEALRQALVLTAEVVHAAHQTT